MVVSIDAATAQIAFFAPLVRLRRWNCAWN
jgi:hypothetical protein